MIEDKNNKKDKEILKNNKKTTNEIHNKRNTVVNKKANTNNQYR